MNKQLIQSFLHSLSGANASIISTLILYPLDNLRTRKIINQQGNNIVNDKNENNENNKYIELEQQQKSKLIKELKKYIKKYYSGISSQLIGNMLSYGIYFFWYELLKKKMKSINPMIITLSAGSITSIFTNPFWVINTRMTHNNCTFLQTLQMMLNEEGMQSLFKGLSTSILLVINPIIQFYFYEKLKRTNLNNRFLYNFINGAISKAVATILTYPYIVIRTYLQANKNHQLNIIAVIKNILKSNGIIGFFSGLKFKLIQTILNAALMLAIYEKIFVLFSNYFLTFFGKSN